MSRDSFKSNIAKQETKTTTEITTPLPLIFKTTYQLKFVFNDPFCITNINELKLVPTTKPILSFSAIEILLEPLQINEKLRFVFFRLHDKEVLSVRQYAADYE